MPSPSPDRPAKHTVLRSFAGHLEGAPDAVFRALAERLGRADANAGDGHVLVDHANRAVIVQGDWWYRAEYRVLPEPAEPDSESDADPESGSEPGTLVEFEIVNVAPTWHWAGPLAGRAVIRDAPHTFQALLTDLS